MIMEEMDILVLSPHTDDSELGAGGTINKAMEQGANIIYTVFSTCDSTLPKDIDGILESEFLEVMELVDPSEYIVLDYEVRHFQERRQEILQDLIDIRDEYSPDVVIGPSTHDYHQDHVVVANEMIRAFKTSSSIIMYELPWNHISFDTQLFVTLNEDDIEGKVNQLSKYDSQIELKDRRYFDESYIFGLARVRGVQSDTEFAEAFEVGRWII